MGCILEYTSVIKTVIPRPSVWRQYVLLGLVSVWFLALGAKVVELQTKDLDYLQSQGDKRYLRELKVEPQRGGIFDRNNQVLTVSTPVKSLVADPRLFCADSENWGQMADLVGVELVTLEDRCEKYGSSEFMYIKRRLPPPLADRALKLKIAGLDSRQEYKRFYPSGDVSSHLVGFTNVDNKGQAGLELFFDQTLKGDEGRSLVLKTRIGQHVENVERVSQVRHGKDVAISIDQRVQSLATEYLKNTVLDFSAASGSVVVVAVPSGELITMVNFPQFNPNDRGSFKKAALRNRAITDPVEPGSTMKPFTIAMALESGEVDSQTTVETAPGHYKIGRSTIRDTKDHGTLSLFDVVVQSSNIGSAKLALSFPYDDLFGTLEKLGFGTRVMNLPGESLGLLPNRSKKIEHATLSYGYGLLATPLQLARAYTALATDGVLLPVTLEKQKKGHRAVGTRVFTSQTAAKVRAMLEAVVSEDGTGELASVPRYRVGGKTGTTHKFIGNEYAKSRYVSSFVGLAPMSSPRFVVAVTIDDPRGKKYFGGDVAAPLFASLTTDLMRLYNIKPDGLFDKDNELGGLDQT